MKIGVTGPNGRLGSALVALGCDPLECDIRNGEEVADAIRSVRPDVIIHTAAFTSVDDAERKDAQEELIVTNVRSLHNFCGTMTACPFIHISTDYVFGGRRGPYTEKMEFSKKDLPVNQYGRSKMAAEAWLSIFPDVTIVRTTGLFGRGKDFISYLYDRMHVDMGAGIDGAIEASANLVSNQTYIPFLAENLVYLAHMKDRPRILHLASYDRCSRYEFAVRVASRYGYSTDRIRPVRSEEISSWVALRPANGGLRTDLAKSLGFRDFSIDDGLDEYFKSVPGNVVFLD